MQMKMIQLLQNIAYHIHRNVLGRDLQFLHQDAVLDEQTRHSPLGNSVSDVKTVNLSPIRYGGYDMQYSAKAESFSSAPIFSSSEDVTASVHVVFTIQ